MSDKTKNESKLYILLSQLACCQDALKVMSNIKDNQFLDFLFRALEDRDERIRFQAAVNISSLGMFGWTIQDQFIDPLINILNDEDPDVRITAVHIIRFWCKDERFIKPLSKLLNDEYQQIRFEAAQALINMRKPSYEDLISNLGDENSEFRAASAEALREMKDDRTVEMLLKALSDEHPLVRSEATSALGIIGNKIAIKALRQELIDKDSDVRYNTVWALFHIADKNAAKPSGTVEPLIDALGNEDERVRVTAAESLGRLKSKNAENALNGLLNDESWDVQRAAAWALIEIWEPSFDDLLNKLQDENACIRVAAISKLNELNEKQVKEHLIKPLKDKCSMVRNEAIIGLSSFKDDEFSYHFLDLLNDNSPVVRASAREGLCKHKDNHIRISVNNALAKDLCDVDDEVRAVAINSMWGMSENIDKNVVAALINTLGDKERDNRLTAASILSLVEATHDQQLIKALDSEDPWIRIMVALILAAKAPVALKEIVSSIESDLVKKIVMVIINRVEQQQ